MHPALPLPPARKLFVLCCRQTKLGVAMRHPLTAICRDPPPPEQMMKWRTTLAPLPPSNLKTIFFRPHEHQLFHDSHVVMSRRANSNCSLGSIDGNARTLPRFLAESLGVSPFLFESRRRHKQSVQLTDRLVCVCAIRSMSRHRPRGLFLFVATLHNIGDIRNDSDVRGNARRSKFPVKT